MKRLLALIGITYLSVLAAAFYLEFKATLVLLIVSLAVSVVFLSIRKIRCTVYLPVVAITTVVACSVNLIFTVSVVETQIDCYSNRHCSIEAALTDESYTRYGYEYYKFNAYSINGNKCDVNFMLVSPEKLDIKPFDTVEFSTTLVDDGNNYYKAKGFYLFAYTGYEGFDYKVISTDNKPLYYYAIKIREYARNAFDSLLPEEEASLCKAVLIGDKFSINSDVLNEFKLTGSSYLIVVSGLHFAIITSFFMKIFKKLLKSKYVYLPFTAIVVLIYMAVTGFSPSVMRSGIMMLLCIIGQIVGRDVYSPNSLGAAAIVEVLIFGPYCAGDIGLLLSFSATYAIVKWAGPLSEFLSLKTKKFPLIVGLINRIIYAICVCICANLLTFPILVFAFNGFSPVTLLSGLIITLPVEIILVCSLLISLLFYCGFFSFAVYPIAFVSYWSSKFVLWFVKIFSGFKFSYIRVGNRFLYIWILMTVFIVLVMLLYRKKYLYVKYTVFSSVTILLAGCVSCILLKQGATDMKVLNAEDGLAVTVDSYSQTAVLDFKCDGGLTTYLLEELKDSTSTIEFLSLTEKNTGKKSAASGLFEEFAISSVLLYDTDSMYNDLCNDTDVYFIDKEFTVTLGRGINVKFYNADGYVFKYLTTECMSVLIVPSYSDISALPDYMRTASVIILNECPDNYDLLSCDTLIVSAGKNKSEVIMSKMLDTANTFMTTADGDITFKLEG